MSVAREAREEGTRGLAAVQSVDGPERAGTTVLAIPGAAPLAALVRNPSGALIESYLPEM